MTNEKNHIYRGFEMISGIGGDTKDGFFVATQIMRLTTQGTLQNVPVDGIAAGKFTDLDSAFDASFERIRQAVNRHIDG